MFGKRHMGSMWRREMKMGYIETLKSRVTKS